MGNGLDGPGAVPGSARFFSSPQRSDRHWGPPNLQSNGYRGIFPGGGVKLHLVPSSRKVELYLHSLRYLHGIVLN
jgi:hypothetical protein